MFLESKIIGEKQNVFFVENSAGMVFSIFENGSVKDIRHESTKINLMDGSLLESGCLNIYLRVRSEEIISCPLFGPNNPGSQSIADGVFVTEGFFEGIRYSCRLLLVEDESCWVWDVQLENTGKEDLQVDLLYVQDVGMTGVGASGLNELYVSQYVDYTALKHEEYGDIVCCRQNEHGPGCVPWLALGSISGVESFSTDGSQFYGVSHRQSSRPEGLSLPKLHGRLQQEFGVVTLQEKPFSLSEGQCKNVGFFGIFHANHLEATSAADLKLIEPGISKLKKLIDTPSPEHESLTVSAKSVFSSSPFFVSDELGNDDLEGFFGGDRRHEEFLDGRLLSFFYGDNRHVVLKAKELLSDRPHGHVMKSGSNLVPDDSTMSFSSFMFGVFLSHVAQGNVNFNCFITTNTNAFNVVRHTGQRIFVKVDGNYQQLGVPSAFEMAMNGCRWFYKQGESLFTVSCRASTDRAEIVLDVEVLKGPGLELLVSNQLTDEHGWSGEDKTIDIRKRVFEYGPSSDSQLGGMYPDGRFEVELHSSGFINSIGGDELLFTDGQSRGLPFVVINSASTKRFIMKITGKLVRSIKSLPKSVSDLADEGWDQETSLMAGEWDQMSSRLKVDQAGAQRREGIDEIFETVPWFAQNAQIHYLAPHGLEQYSGAAWGSRDICQGPLEMLLSLGHYSQAREILATVMSNQNSDGNWPQWWMFDRYNNVRSSDAHGDVIFWPILAVSEYIRATGDYGFLDEKLPFYDGQADSQTEYASVLWHIIRSVNNISSTRMAAGTKLVNYSEGDWNDSLQPANKQFQDRLISSWTVALSYQSLTAFAEVCRFSGHIDIAQHLERLCEKIRRDFSTHLISDGVVAGFGLLNDSNEIDLLLHPSDSSTGIHYRLLPMIRGIIGELFTPDQAKTHAGLIEKHLKGPDGARLMDCPPKYQGGLQQYFKRGESSPFFGREIGLMYTHAHLRYAEAMAKMGYADKFMHALRQVVPIGIDKIIANANVRQSNCYYSSSDGHFASRYDVNDNYDDLLAGKVEFKGGWRIYSSGPGIFIKLVMSHLLGVRHSYNGTVFDPVLTFECDGLVAHMEFVGRDVKFIYHVKTANAGVEEIKINGIVCKFQREINPYRRGGAVVSDQSLEAALSDSQNVIEITL